MIILSKENNRQMSMQQATMYNLVAKFAVMIIQLVLNMILARIIEPAAFGIISIITVLVNFFNLFADMGVGVSVIQRTDLTVEDHNQLYTFSLYIGVVLSIIILLLSYPVSLIYNDNIYMILCPGVSIVAIVNSLNTVPNALLTKDKRFDLIALRSIICNFISGIITVILAFIGLGVYALLLHSILSASAVFIWNYQRCHLRFKMKINKKRLLECMGTYSLFQLLFNMLNYLTRNLDNLIVGAKLGDESLGYYNKAYTLNLYPNLLFTNVISGVLHPYMRDFKNDLMNLYQKLMRIVKPLSLVGMLVQMVFYWCADEIVMIMYGSQWGQAAVCFKWLSLCVWAQMLSSVCGAVFLGLQRTDQTFKCGIINIFIIVLAILTGVINESLMVLSLSIAIAYNIIFLITYFVLIVRTMHMNLRLLVSTIGIDGIALMLFIIIVSCVPVSFQTGTWLSLAAKCGIIFLYCIVYLLVSKQFRYVLNVFKTMMTSVIRKRK